MKLAPQINHQQQPTPVCCSATCIAMAVGEPVESLGINLERAYDFKAFGCWLAEHGLWLRPMLLFQGQGERLHNGALYLIGARSLNNVNSDHAVLLDTRGPRKEGPNFNERSGWKCFDPNEGREGKQSYTWIDEHLALDACELRQHNHLYGRVGRAP